MVSVELLRKQKLLQGLDESILIDLGNSMRFEQFQKRDFVFHKGSTGDALVMLMSGRLQIIALSEDNREVGLSFLEPGDYCGELSIIDGLPRSASAIATTESMVGFMPKSRAQWLFLHHPPAVEQLLQKLSRSIRQASQIRSVLGMTRSYARIYAVLMNAAQNQNGALTTIENLPTQQAIAIMANVSRETVSRAIQALIANGIVQKDFKRLIVRQPALLEKLSKGEVEIQISRKAE
ncbi:MAG: putative cyclic nucleotide-binding regulatory protein [Burkholderiaceae bacterium]|nr:putative cyclic nucleotide-binding regulatory protein [Burkholderiaceae bacterium]